MVIDTINSKLTKVKTELETKRKLLIKSVENNHYNLTHKEVISRSKLFDKSVNRYYRLQKLTNMFYKSVRSNNIRLVKVS